MTVSLHIYITLNGLYGLYGFSLYGLTLKRCTDGAIFFVFVIYISNFLGTCGRSQLLNLLPDSCGQIPCIIVQQRVDDVQHSQM